MTILLTGAFGFVGTNLAAWLARSGHRLVALDVVRQTNPSYAAAYAWDQDDALPWDSMEAVVHLAGMAHDTRGAVDPQAYFDVNLGLTRRVFEWFVASQARTFVFFSSVKAAADRVPPGVALAEDALPDPRTPYGQSKRAAEEHLLSLPLPSDRRLYILRPCMIHGPGNKGNLNLLYGFVRRGIPYPLGAFDNQRSFAAMDNVCHVVENLLRLRPASGIYHVADDEPIATSAIVATMAESLGHRPRIWRLNRNLVRACARVGDGLHLPLTSERLDKLTESYVVSNAKIKSALGMSAMPIRALDGLRATLRGWESGALAPG